MTATAHALHKNLQDIAEVLTNGLALKTPVYLTHPATKKACWMGNSSPVTVSTTTDSGGEPTLHPILPVEIIDTIFLFLPTSSLKSLQVTNSFIFTLATRRLYHTVVLTRSISVLYFLNTLQRNPELPQFVRNLSINMARSSPISNFYILLQKVFRLTTGLLSLFLELPKAHSPLWIFEGCTFKLKQFTTTMHCRRPLADFLETQDRITDLTLRGYQNESIFLPFIDPLPPSMLLGPDVFSLSSEALPRLRSFNAVHADACIVQAVVQGRPVEVASIPLFPEMGLAALDALKTSKVPLKRLSVISFDPAAPAFLVEALAKRFDQLEAMHLVLLMAEYTNELLEESGALLSHFKCLKYITFMAATTPTEPSVSTTAASGASDTTNAVTVSSNGLEEEEARIARTWHRACPSLCTIILPKGKVWFQNQTESAENPDSGSTSTREDAPTTLGQEIRREGIRKQEFDEKWSHL